MAAPKAKTKMTRSNWSKSKRPNTKSRDLAVSKNVTVMVRYGSKDIGRYATTYMSRDNAAIPALEDIGVKPHDIDVDITSDDVAKNDISRESMGAKQENRLFDSANKSLSKLELAEKLKVFSSAQKAGHTPIIEVVSFSKDYLQHQNILSKSFTDEKGLITRSLDDSKLRIAIADSVERMATQSGFSKLEYVAAIHGNTQHPHVHIAMIETDDNATGRLAAREDNDQLANDADDTKIIGKSPAAISYDRKNHVQNTVERGMIRQSEMDYFRQEIDHSLTNMSQLVTVRDLEYQQTYASVVNLDVMRQAYHDKEFVADFTRVASLLRKPIHETTMVTQALDYRVEKMSRQLLSGSDFGQKEYMSTQYRLGVKLTKEKALRNAILIHSTESPSEADVEDYRTMGLDADKYNGVVLTPTQFLEKHGDLDPKTHLAYVDRYTSFIKEPNLRNLDGLVLKRPDDLNIDDNLGKFLEKQDQQLVNMTKASIYQMLMDVKSTDVGAKDIRDSLVSSLKSVHTANHQVDQIKGKDNSDDYVKSFQKRLRSLGVQKPLIGDKLSEIVAEAESYSQPETMPTEIKSARTLLQNEYKDNIQDLDAMMTISKGKRLPKEQRQELLEQSRNLRELTLGKGNLTSAGSMLHAALSAEIYNTGSLNRVHKLKLGERESLFAAYRETTVGKLAAVKTAVEDLNQGVSFTEPQSQQSLRSELTDTLDEMADGYEARLEYVSKVEDIAKLPDDAEKKALTQLMLSQALWRQGMDEGLAAKDIQQNIKEHESLSDQDKLATAMTLRLNELSSNIEVSIDRSSSIVEEMRLSQNGLDDDHFDSSKLLNDHIVHQSLQKVDDTENTVDVVEDEPLDVVYNPDSYALLVQNKQVMKQRTVAKQLSDTERLSLNLVVGHFNEAMHVKNDDFDQLEEQRRESERLSYEDLVIVDNDIAIAYDKDNERELYEKQQLLANITDVELLHNVQSLDVYERNMSQRIDVPDKDAEIVHDIEHEIETVAAKEPIVEINHAPKNDQDKDRDKGITR